MAKRSYTTEQLIFIEQFYKQFDYRDVTRHFNRHFGENRSESAIKSAINKYGFKADRKPGYMPGKAPKLLNETEVAFLRDHYKDMDCNVLTAAFNKQFGRNLTPSQIKPQLSKHGIKSGRTGQFKKGVQGWNAGLAGKGICKPNSGSFQKGLVPHNHVPVGSERVNRDGYVEIKVAEPRKWQLKHRFVWEQHHGKLAPNEAIVLIDGNGQNCHISNLRKVERKHLAVLNKCHKLRQQPMDVRDTLIAITKLEAKTKELRA